LSNNKLNLNGICVVRTDAEIECNDIDNWFISRGANLVLLPGDVSEKELCSAVSNASLILMCYTTISSAVIQSASQLRGIVKYGVGIDAIDIVAATERGVPVVNVPEYAEQTVAEGAFCLMLALVKKLLPIHRAMQQDGWIDPARQWLGSDISGKCVAIVGAGRIGRAFARMAGHGFGARVIAYDPHVSSKELKSLGIAKIDDLHELLGQADIVSMHTVLNDSTHTMIGREEFAAMRRCPVLINVSRGALIDESALLEALDNQQIAAAGLDVFSNEPLNRTSHKLSSLYERDNVILSPHLTFFTHEAMQRLTADTLARCEEVLRGESVVIRSKDPRLLAQHGILNVKS